MEEEYRVSVRIRRNRWEPTEWIICDEEYDDKEEVVVIYLLCNGFPGTPKLNKKP